MKKTRLLGSVLVLLLLAACGAAEPVLDAGSVAPEAQETGNQTEVQAEETYLDDEDMPQTEADNFPEDFYVYEGDVLHIGDRFFATQINDILLNNFDRYLGRVIRYEGMFWSLYWEWTDRYYHYVIRYTYGCCGDHDSSAGFELALGRTQPPPDDTWVEVTGILERSDGEGISHVRLRVISLVVLEERGLEFVPN
ncbi:MAG: hypothetical protein FWD84_06425 [Oscillospiraceae bacterium]|nr:hypothetical protein [Oscillospiraceae bacterium]